MARSFLFVCGGSGKKTLGQEQALGMHGEIQIDVKGEVLTTTDPTSQRTTLSARLNTTAEVADWQMKSFDPNDTSPAASHARFLSTYLPITEPITEGLGRSPAMGAAVLRQKMIWDNLLQAVETLIQNYAGDLGPENPLTAWIISSTAGGTGEGTHRAVARALIECLKKRDAPYHINFLRLGPMTYQGVDGTRTSLNTFFGVAADAAFTTQQRKVAPQAPMLWYYFDLRDVGKDDRGTKDRLTLVEMTAKALMLEDVGADLSRLLIGGRNTVIVRADFRSLPSESENELLDQALCSLEEKLERFINPRQEDLTSGGGPRLVRVDLDEILAEFDQDKLIKKVKKWKLDSHKGPIKKTIDDSSRFRKDRKYYEKLWEDAYTDEWKQCLTSWRSEVNRWIEPKVLTELQDYLEIDEEQEVDGTLRPVPSRFGAPNRPTSVYTSDWFVAVRKAQRAKAWSEKRLDLLEPELRDLAADLAKDLKSRFKQDRDKAKRADDLTAFVEKLEEVILLRESLDKSNALLKSLMASLASMLLKVRERIAKSGSAVSQRLIDVADLDDVLDQRYRQVTWLARLHESSSRPGGFDQEVKNGAVALTNAGLCTLLGIDKADKHTVQQALQSFSGRAGEQPPWWQNQVVQAAQGYRYRLLPRIDSVLQQQLGNGDGNISYKYNRLGAIGLNILALEAAVIGQPNDPNATPAFLLTPLVKFVQEKLADWTDPPTQSSAATGKALIAQTMPVGEPLAREPMQLAGLTPVELKKLEEFFELI